MASRLDAIQVALPRAADSAAQQHAQQRQPVVAQEQVTAANRQEAEARQERAEALARREGGQVRNNLIPPARERGTGARNARKRPQTGAAARAGRKAEAADAPPDGKGTRVDLRL